jgi:uncharacterized membrane protein YcgQ (UPF0703/DUF1980 family)
MSNELMSLEDQARLELSLKTRELIIKDLTKGGKLPEDTSSRTFLVAALDGLDRTVLSKAKLKSDDSAQKTQAEASKMIAQLLTHVDSRPKVRRTTDDLVLDMEVTPLPGETDIGVKSFTYSEMMPPQE